MRGILFIGFMMCVGVLTANVVQSGIADLRKHDFSAEPIVELNGDWDYYPHELLSDSLSEPVTITVPVRWEKQGMPAFNYGTFKTKILLKTDIPLMFKVPDQFSAWNVYINGQLREEVGKVGPDDKHYSPGRRVLYLRLGKQQTDTVELTLEVTNYTHSKGGIGNAILLGTEEVIGRKKLINDAYDLFLTGCLVMGAFFFIGLYLHGREEKTPLFFAFFSLCYAYRVLGWGNYLLHDLVDMPYRLGITLEFASFYLCGYFFAVYLRALFPLDTPKLVVKIFSYSSLVWATTTLLPVHIFTRLNIPYLYILLVGILMMVFVFIKATLKKRPGAMYSLYSLIGILIIFSIKSLDYLGYIEEIKLVSIIGEIMFFLFQSLILSKHFSTSWRDAKLQAELSAKAKSDFLSVMSHEIRTPLNAVIGTAYHLLDENPREDQREDLNNLKNSSENLLLLINNILDYNKIDSGKLELEANEVVLRDYCDQQISMFQVIATAKNLQLILEYDERLPKAVLMDKTRVSQVLINLLGNALKFTKTGEVRFSATLLSQDEEEQVVMFSVKDTGIGIDQKSRYRIFQSFEQANNSITREYGGTGLGLAISEKLLKLMGSEIVLQSEPGKGSEFSFMLRLKAVENVKPQIMDEARTDFRGIRVLLVEDNEMNVMVAKRLLAKWEVTVEVAENGEIGVEMACSEYFDVILMDLQMPVMDGFQATKILRAKGITTPIIALTAAAIDQKATFLKQNEMDDLLVKPYKPDQLSQILVQYVGARQTSL